MSTWHSAEAEQEGKLILDIPEIVVVFKWCDCAGNSSSSDAIVQETVETVVQQGNAKQCPR
jgi:hypothetical protein